MSDHMCLINQKSLLPSLNHAPLSIIFFSDKYAVYAFT